MFRPVLEKKCDRSVVVPPSLLFRYSSRNITNAPWLGSNMAAYCIII